MNIETTKEKVIDNLEAQLKVNKKLLKVVNSKEEYTEIALEIKSIEIALEKLKGGIKNKQNGRKHADRKV